MRKYLKYLMGFVIILTLAASSAIAAPKPSIKPGTTKTLGDACNPSIILVEGSSQTLECIDSVWARRSTSPATLTLAGFNRIDPKAGNVLSTRFPDFSGTVTKIKCWVDDETHVGQFIVQICNGIEYNETTCTDDMITGSQLTVDEVDPPDTLSVNTVCATGCEKVLQNATFVAGGGITFYIADVSNTPDFATCIVYGIAD